MATQGDELEGLLVEARASGVPQPVGGSHYRPIYATKHHPSGPSAGVNKVSYTHDAMIDLIIADPTISQNRLATHFGYTAGWVSQIIASDAFQARLAERTGELVDPTIRATVQDRFKAIVLRSLELLKEKLDRPAASIPDNLVLRSLEVGSRALGYGVRDAQPVVVDVDVHLNGLADNLTKLLQRKKAELPPIEGELG